MLQQLISYVDLLVYIKVVKEYLITHSTSASSGDISIMWRHSIGGQSNAFDMLYRPMTSMTSTHKSSLYVSITLFTRYYWLSNRLSNQQYRVNELLQCRRFLMTSS